MTGRIDRMPVEAFDLRAYLASYGADPAYRRRPVGLFRLDRADE